MCRLGLKGVLLPKASVMATVLSGFDSLLAYKTKNTRPFVLKNQLTFKLTTMKLFKVYGTKPYEHFIQATSASDAIATCNKEYPSFGANQAIDTTSDDYQSSFDSDQFDGQGRRKF
jgi:hypothetical protein